MLQRVGPSVLTAREAEKRGLLPFPSKLEFNPPAHGTWNIVHIGMLVPEAHQVYVCAVNCMRGVVLTAAEMGASDRFSCVLLKEEDITRGTVEEVTLEGIADVLHKLEERDALPPCVMVFPVCTHLFLGVSMARVYRELERRFPQVDFVRAFMDPISRKRLFPDRRLRRAMYEPLERLEPTPRLLVSLGSDFALDADSDLRHLLAAGGWTYQDIQSCTTYAEFKELARAEAFVCTFPGGQLGAEACARRLGRACLYLPSTFSFEEIETQERRLCAELGLPLPDFDEERRHCEQELARTHEVVGATPVALDALAHPRPLGMARLLLTHGIDVEEVYLDAVSPEEEQELAWLGLHTPQVQVSAMTMPDLRVAPRTRAGDVLAIGQRAAWFTGTAHFVNIVQGAGLWGFAGISHLARLMRVAMQEEKDARDLIPRKGLGCVSCI